MAAVGISSEQQEGVFRLLAAILHLGDLTFCEAEGVKGSNRDEAAPVPKDADSQQALAVAAQLLGVDPHQLLTCLTTRTRQTPEGG
jgi:myosin-5